jgi:hypothetical protein
LWQSWSLRQPQDDPVTETNSLLLPRRNENPDFGSGSIFFVGNATVLIRCAGFTILTDPNFLHAGDHVHLGYGLTSPRSTSSFSCTCTGITSTAWPRRPPHRHPHPLPRLRRLQVAAGGLQTGCEQGRLGAPGPPREPRRHLQIRGSRRARRGLIPTKAASSSGRGNCDPSDNLGCPLRLRSRTFRRMALPGS